MASLAQVIYATAVMAMQPTAVPAEAMEPHAVAENVEVELGVPAWGRVVRVQEIPYPPKSLAAGLTGIVELDLEIDAIGGVKRIVNLRSVPSNSEFEQVVSESIGRATFVVPMTKRCVPTESTGSVTFSFDIVEGKGRVVMLHRGPTSRPDDVGHASRVLNQAELTAAAKGSYPEGPRRIGAQARVSLLVKVDARTGAVIDAQPTHVITRKGLERLFGRSAATLWKLARYPLMPDEIDTWTTCASVDYRLRSK
jgi:hypothetical protein